MIQTLQRLAQTLHGVADAADRLNTQPAVEAAIKLSGPSDRDEAEAIDRGQKPETLKRIIAAVRRELDKK